MLRMLMAFGLASIVVLGVVACGSDPTAVPEPTEVNVAVSLPTVAPDHTATPVEPVESTEGVTMPTSIEGPEWSLIAFGNPPTRPITDTVITAQFVDGSVSGNASCNGYFAEYTVEGSSITIGMPGMTMMACTEDIMAQEQAYLAAIQQANSFSVDEGGLMLTTADGQLLLFMTDPPFVFDGSKWIVTSFNNGKEAMTSVIIGTELTAEFTADNISGSAGCNDYNATYEADDETIAVGPASATRKMCAEPEGIMEQEQQFLAALATAEVWSVQTGRLELRTADGAGAVYFDAVLEEEATE